MKTIRELRDGHGWKQPEPAVKGRVKPLTVYNWERGKYEPSASKLRQIAQAFDVSMDDIALVQEQGKAAAKASINPTRHAAFQHPDPGRDREGSSVILPPERYRR